MDKDDGLFSPSLKISLEKKWVDPKIVKSQVEVSVRKSFALDINLSAVEEKLIMICCIVVGFEFDDDLESVFHTEPIYNGIKLFRARMDLVYCVKYRHFGHSAFKCDASKVLVLFKSWVQVVSLAYSSGSTHFKSGSSFPSLGILHLGSTLPSTSDNNSGLSNCLAVLEHFLELLSDQISVLLKKLSFVELVSLTVSPFASPPVVSVSLAFVLNSDMVLNNVLVLSTSFFSVGSDLVANFSSSSSKVLTTKMGFVWKIATCNAQSMNNSVKQKDIVHWHKNMGNLILIITKTKLSNRVCPWIADKFNGVFNMIVGRNVMDIGNHFNTDYYAVSVLDKFKDATTANAAVFSENFTISKHLLDLDIFRRKWFKDFDSVFTKKSSRFHKLELLVSKIAKASCKGDEIVDSGAGFDCVCLALFSIENFAVNKDNTIKNILEHPFPKVVLDHLVVRNELILEPNLIKTKVDVVMKDWTRKCNVFGSGGGVFTTSLVHILKVKRQKSICGYKLNFYFVAKTGHLESQAELTFFLAAAATQHILDVASKFFQINNISINNDKTVAILINCRIMCPNLSISSLPIFIAKKGESHCYLEIFLSTESLLKPSLAKANADVRFFANLVLRKTISNKQFLYLVLAVLQLIVSYKTQFSFVPISTCDKWDSLICRNLKLKSGLPLDFPNNALYYPLLYGLKTFKQVQAENKVASVVCFVNSLGILNQLFLYRFHNLQVLSWGPFHLLVSPMCIKVSASNNFLASVVHIFLGCGLSLDGHVNNSFHFCGRMPMSSVLGKTDYFKFFLSFWKYGIAFVDQLCGKNEAFRLSVNFLNSVASFSSLDILESSEFELIYDQLLNLKTDCFSVYMDGSLRSLKSVDMRASAAVFFENISLNLSVSAIALAVKYVPPNSSVGVFTDSQAVLDACKSELGLVYPDFWNCCWVECWHIVNIIRKKNLSVSWHKVKGHSGVMDNECANTFADTAFLSLWCLIPRVKKHRILAEGNVVSDNSRHFICGVFWSILRACWELFARDLFSKNDFEKLSLNEIWLVYAKHQACIETSRMIPQNGSAPASVLRLFAVLSKSVVRLLGIAKTIGVGYEFRKSYLFFLGIGDLFSMHIDT
ncbi:hypothetical protein G9A89_019356 [Geosiphon pyriformis]|nr:hypothetical protein G9A89_019356 [Geosiphon pyriformis]